ncbi:MAG: hypothetical protein J7J86_05360 [Bacteroidales bacterium]|nr:hypothetical protein [Bacteroidales bacterium]
MALFKIGNRLEYIMEKPFKLEKEIQTLTEQNLNTIFGLDFVKSEFALNNFRIDTLAFDKDANAFVIIEYKRDKNFSVIDQGYAYLSLMLNNKADFILEFNENLDKTLKRNDLDWSQSRVMFISPAFTTYQREAINFKDLPIELWEVKRYENNSVAFEQIQKAGAQESIKTISKTDKTIDHVIKEIKVYSEQEHLENVNEEIEELYEKFKNAILNLDNLEVKPKKKYIAFVAGRNVIDILPQKKALKMWINMSKGELEDTKGITRDVSTTGHWGNGDFEIQVKDDENLEYILSLVKQSIRKNKK